MTRTVAASAVLMCAATRGLGYYNDGSSGSEEEEWIEIEPSMVDPAGPIQLTDGSVLGILSVQ